MAFIATCIVGYKMSCWFFLDSKERILNNLHGHGWWEAIKFDNRRKPRSMHVAWRKWLLFNNKISQWRVIMLLLSFMAEVGRLTQLPSISIIRGDPLSLSQFIYWRCMVYMGLASKIFPINESYIVYHLIVVYNSHGHMI